VRQRDGHSWRHSSDVALRRPYLLKPVAVVWDRCPVTCSWPETLLVWACFQKTWYIPRRGGVAPTAPLSEPANALITVVGAMLVVGNQSCSRRCLEMEMASRMLLHEAQTLGAPSSSCADGQGEAGAGQDGRSIPRGERQRDTQPGRRDRGTKATSLRASWLRCCDCSVLWFGACPVLFTAPSTSQQPGRRMRCSERQRLIQDAVGPIGEGHPRLERRFHASNLLALLLARSQQTRHGESTPVKAARGRER
jgi:hypothetical protein